MKYTNDNKKNHQILHIEFHSMCMCIIVFFFCLLISTLKHSLYRVCRKLLLWMSTKSIEYKCSCFFFLNSREWLCNQLILQLKLMLIHTVSIHLSNKWFQFTLTNNTVNCMLLLFDIYVAFFSSSSLPFIIQIDNVSSETLFVLVRWFSSIFFPGVFISFSFRCLLKSNEGTVFRPD